METDWKIVSVGNGSKKRKYNPERSARYPQGIHVQLTPRGFLRLSRLQRSMLTIETKSSERTQNLPRREAQTVRLESEHSGRNQPKKTEPAPHLELNGGRSWSPAMVFIKTQPTDLPWCVLFVAVGHYCYSVYLYIIMHPVCTSYITQNRTKNQTTMYVSQQL